MVTVVIITTLALPIECLAYLYIAIRCRYYSAAIFTEAQVVYLGVESIAAESPYLYSVRETANIH